MGQIADDIVDGSCCTMCGQYFQDPDEDKIYTHEYPVACKRCFRARNRSSVNDTVSKHSNVSSLGGAYAG